MVERIVNPGLNVLRALTGVPVIESQFSQRGTVLHVRSGAFLDSPSPALVMHPIDAQIMVVSIEREQPMSDPSVAFEGFRRYAEAWLTKRLRIANRRIGYPTPTEVRDQYHSSDPSPTAVSTGGDDA